MSLEAAYVTRDELGVGQITTTAPTNPMQLRPDAAENRKMWGRLGASAGWRRETWIVRSTRVTGVTPAG